MTEQKAERLAKLEAWAAAMQAEHLLHLTRLREVAAMLLAACEDALKTPIDKSYLANRRARPHYRQ